VRKQRYKLGYDDGSGKEDRIYDTVEQRVVAVTNWGCSCCRPSPSSAVTEMAQRIADAMSAYKPPKAKKGKKK
jgi:hypothetical protein